jgi:hypothetical protein
MKRVHPKVSYAAAFGALAIGLPLGGCKSPSGGGIANPFLAPDRVPPPATRALAPGQAQPYYPGDPLPVMQSKATPPAIGAAVAATEPQMPSADTNLAWTSPKQSVSGSITQPISIAPNNAQPPRPMIAAAEPAVAIPADGDSLRFELASPAEPQPFAAVAATPMPAPQQPLQLAAAPTISSVVPASYSEPTVSALPPAPNPWRAPEITPVESMPQLGPPPAAPIAVQQPPLQPAMPAPPAWPTTWPASPPPTLMANNIDVQLRAVPSPPAELYAPSTPRIRLPGSLPQAPMVGSDDGFRPRSSMR